MKALLVLVAVFSLNCMAQENLGLQECQKGKSEGRKDAKVKVEDKSSEKSDQSEIIKG